jgi:hypothetical protein
MLIATVPYVGKRLHLDPEPDPKLNSGSEHANNFGSIRIRIHNPGIHRMIFNKYKKFKLFNKVLIRFKPGSIP